MVTIEEIIKCGYVVITNSGETLRFFSSTESNDFLECKDKDNERITIKRSDVRLVTKEEIYKFQKLID